MPYTDNDPMLDVAGVCAEVGDKTPMTLWRWQRDERVQFPQPDLMINNRRYWYRSSIKRWQASMAARSNATAAPRGRIDHTECAA